LVLKGDISGLAPGAHGIGIHKYGDTSNSCASTGSLISSLQNVVADAAGKDKYMANGMSNSLFGEDTILGRSIVIYSGSSSYSKSACCTITRTGSDKYIAPSTKTPTTIHITSPSSAAPTTTIVIDNKGPTIYGPLDRPKDTSYRPITSRPLTPFPSTSLIDTEQQLYSKLVGGFSQFKPLDTKTRHMVHVLKPEIELKFGHTLNYFFPEAYRSQVVAGTKYIVSINTNKGRIEVTIVEPLPHTGQPARVTEVRVV
jgi:hypothetical protein